MSGVSIGMGEEDGSKVIILYVEGQGRIVFGSHQAILYGKTLMAFGSAAECMNDAVEEEIDEDSY